MAGCVERVIPCHECINLIGRKANSLPAGNNYTILYNYPPLKYFRNLPTSIFIVLPLFTFRMVEKIQVAHWLISCGVDHMTPHHVQGANQSSVLGVTLPLSPNVNKQNEEEGSRSNKNVCISPSNYGFGIG